MGSQLAVRALRLPLVAFLCAFVAFACGRREGITAGEEGEDVPRAAFVNLSGEFWLFHPDMEEVTGSPFRVRVSETDCADGGTAHLDVGPERVRLFDDASDPTVLDRVGLETTTTRVACDGARTQHGEPFRVTDRVLVASPDSIWFDWHQFCGRTVCLDADGEVSDNLDRAVRTTEGFRERVLVDGHEVTLTYYREAALPVEPPR